MAKRLYKVTSIDGQEYSNFVLGDSYADAVARMQEQLGGDFDYLYGDGFKIAFEDEVIA